MLTPETSLCKPEVYESKRIQLTSPLLHIGSAVSKLSPFEYVQTAKRVYLPNQEALAKALHQRGRLQEYIRRIEDQEPITSLLEDTLVSTGRISNLLMVSQFFQRLPVV
jgi:CRISPR-associated protein Csm5